MHINLIGALQQQVHIVLDVKAQNPIIYIDTDISEAHLLCYDIRVVKIFI